MRTPIILKAMCNYCGSPFEYRLLGAKKKSCSKECAKAISKRRVGIWNEKNLDRRRAINADWARRRYKAAPIHQVWCVVCASGFQTSHGTKKTCSKKCSIIWWGHQMDLESRKNLTDTYIKRLLRHKVRRFNNDIIELKRIHLTLKRAQHERRKELTQNP